MMSLQAADSSKKVVAMKGPGQALLELGVMCMEEVRTRANALCFCAHSIASMCGCYCVVVPALSSVAAGSANTSLITWMHNDVGE